MNIVRLVFLFSIWLVSQSLNGQCDEQIAISGETILCPNGNSTLSTSEYDSYQWYSRAWGSDIALPIDNAINQSFEVTKADVLTYISVEVSYDTCTVFSNEVLIDQWAFLLPYIIHEGEYAEVVNGVTYVCPEHDFGFQLGLPYAENVTWFLDGNAIPDSDTTFWQVEESGSYTVSGAPSECPDYIVPLGLSVAVVVYDSNPLELILNQETNIIFVEDASPFDNFEWYFEGELIQAGINDTLIFSAPGDYSIIATDANGCERSAEISILPSSITEFELSTLSIYPNPTLQILNIDAELTIGNYFINNSLGESVLNGPTTGQIDVSTLQPGTYILQLKTSKNESYAYFIKQ